MLAYIPVVFDIYRPLKPRLRWAMQCLVSFADHTGRCFPSIRTFALHAGISRSAAQRDLADLTAAGLVIRKRRPGGVYIYRIDRRFLPNWPKKLVSQLRHRKQQTAHGCPVDQPSAGVPTGGTKENLDKKNQGHARMRARFANRVSCEDLPDYDSRWPLRLQGWQKSRFWLPNWGPKPTEPGCCAPPALLHATISA
ncbi:MAG: helix-turn-helix domain-containing protein [Rhodopila sp.]